MGAADEELLRLLRAVKAHEPTGRGRFDDDDENDDALALDYADAFDEDAVLLCLNALQAAVDAGEWRASPTLARLVDELLDWRIGALDLDRKPKTELLVVRWRFISRAIEADAVDKSGDALAARLLETMAGDRFAALDVQYAVAQCLCGAIDRDVVVGASEQALALLKQFYVTLARASARQQLGAAMCALLRSKYDVKRALGDVGLLRAVVQVALMEQRALDSKRAFGQDLEEDEDDKMAKLIETAVRTLRHVARLTCPQSDALEFVSSDLSTPRALCDAVVELALSRVTDVFEESVRLLQMLVECPPCLAALPSVPDLRGALDKAKTLATTPEGKPTVQDAYVRSLCEQLGALLVPQIDAHEQRHGSLVGLSGALDHEAALSPETALEAALECKTRGNAFYQRGNFATARLFYRRAIAIVRSAEFQAERRLGTLPVEELRRQCSVGASVQVLQRNGALRSAMVSDVEDDEDVVEVLYDDGDEEEERVPLRRLRLRMATQLLEQFKTVAVDCWMNMGKAFSMLFDHERAIECYSGVLALQSQYIAALYHRGVASLVVHDLQRAQKDLWEANQLCSKWKTLGDAIETNKKKALHAQIVAAYKKLQTLHASKKKVDKRLIKQMMGYISSLPGLQDGTMDDGSNI